ncbi:MAG: vitamin K epoxide reductase family protein [Bacteroidota bacterium]
MKDSLSYLLTSLLKFNRISVDVEELTFQVQTHPSYPSLHSMTGVLDHFNIEHVALEISVHLDIFEELPHSFLAQIEKDAQKQFVVVKRTKTALKLIYHEKKSDTVSYQNFLEIFTGIVLIVDVENSGVELPSSSKFDLRKLLAITVGLSSLGLLARSSYDLIDIIFLALSLLGIYLTKTILLQEQGESSVLGDAFCSSKTEKKNCHAVLTSNGARLTKSLKLSDLSMMYFLGLTMSSWLLSINNFSLFLPKLISVGAVAVTLYSIYYQAWVIRKWCFLCLSLVGILWAQAFLSILTFTVEVSLYSVLLSLFSFAASSAIWLVYSKLKKEKLDLVKIKLEHYKFVRNFDLFNSQLLTRKAVNTDILGTEDIIFGNRRSKLEIVFITNPLCGHCKAVHELTNQVLHSYGEDIKLTIRFNVNPQHKGGSAIKICARLLEIYHLEGQRKCLEAMHDIYGDYLPKQWLNKWGYPASSETYISALEKSFYWCFENSINFTPEILVNGHSYPKLYNRKDLIYFIEELSESEPNPVEAAVPIS